ncbi:MAG: isoprenoid biosynthesis glyoxalase ElbB [Planctomycetes bacterium]|nr:isoprenoid biosynthesis glyoxalase ElbB [Planctomycetota bacterium]
MTRVGVCLAGCGFLDGAEIREAVLTLLSLSRAGAEVICFAPDQEQMHVVDHLRGEPVEGESRNVLVESARIARGDIMALVDFDLDLVDALVFPGGFGVGKNLCDFADQGSDCTVQSEVEDLIRAARARDLPMGFICIAPALAAAALRGSGEELSLTIGRDASTAEALAAMGAQNTACDAHQAQLDDVHKVASTPAYMLEAPLHEIAQGIDEMVQEVLAMVRRHAD